METVETIAACDRHSSWSCFGPVWLRRTPWGSPRNCLRDYSSGPETPQDPRGGAGRYDCGSSAQSGAPATWDRRIPAQYNLLSFCGGMMFCWQVRERLRTNRCVIRLLPTLKLYKSSYVMAHPRQSTPKAVSTFVVIVCKKGSHSFIIISWMIRFTQHFWLTRSYILVTHHSLLWHLGKQLATWLYWRWLTAI